MKERTIAIVNQKGGVAKTTTTLNLGAELAKAGNKVLLVDFDPQSSLTIALGQFDENIPSIADLMQLEIEDRDLLNKGRYYDYYIWNGFAPWKYCVGFYGAFSN